MNDSHSNRVSFDDVVRYMSDPARGLIGDFPAHILRDRLNSIGARDAVEESAIAKWGFPFKYHHTLDEGILVLNFFLNQSRMLSESCIQINSTHVPTKDEESTLSSWKSPKAGLYLDLHELIENHNHNRGKPNLIKRAFVLRDHAQLAFLESTGIGVILEQESIGIETGFMLTREMGPRVAQLTWAGVLLVQLLHEDENECQWFLGIDKAVPSQEPYVNNIICKWHKGRVMDGANLTPSAREEGEHIDLKEYLDLFRFDDCEPERKIGDRSYRFEKNPQRFRRLLTANYKVAFPFGEVSPEEYERHLNYRAIPENLVQLGIALDQLKQSFVIKAIDAASVKSTLRVHEADPNYRHWIRTSVQRALKNPDAVSLERIYILRGVRDEFEVFRQEVDLYRDLMSNHISRLDRSECGSQQTINSAGDSRINIRLYAVTKKVVDQVCRELDDETKNALLRLLADDFRRRSDARITSIVSELDFLYSENLIFNYKDYKGEPGRAFYDADLFLPGTPQNEANKKDGRSKIVEYLKLDDFKNKQLKYASLFEILKKRSIEVLPNESATFETLDAFEMALEQNGIEKISVAETIVAKQTLSASKSGLIFVSHAREDSGSADEICGKLENAGYQTWNYRRDVGFGQEKIYVQEAAIATCDFFLICHSEKYDKDGEIQAEIALALERAKRVKKWGSFVLLVRLDDYPVRYDLDKFYSAKLYEKGDWQDDVWKKLIDSIKQELNRRDQT